MKSHFTHFNSRIKTNRSFRANWILCLLISITLLSCKDDTPAPTPQLGEYANYEDCPIDAIGELNGYNFEGSSLVRANTEYPADHFQMAVLNFRNFGAQSFLLVITGMYDTVSVGSRSVPIADNLRDTIRVPLLQNGEVAVGASLRFDGGVSTSGTSVSYFLDEGSSSNFFILDSVNFVNNDPQLRGGMWYGHFDLKFHLEETSENREGVNFGRSVGLQIPETLHYKEVSFSAPTRVDYLEFNCGR